MLRIEYVPVNRLREYENNPRNNELAVEKVAASIKRLGFLYPIIIDINYVIVCGHTRKRACELAGIKSVPCIRVEHLSPEQINYFRLVDNRTSEYASWDFTKLESELKLIDLEVVENYLLLEQFDLDTEVTDLDCKMNEIQVESFNFVQGDSYRQDKDDLSGDCDNDSAICSGGSKSSKIDSVQTPNSESHAESIGNGVDGAIPPEEKTASLYNSTASFFEVGKIRFYISKVELEMLNKAYIEYMDKIYPKKTFVQYLIGR